jgi:hypothetical protein
LGAKYSNAYAIPEDEQATNRQLATFKNLVETWSTPEIQPWHKHVGDSWGPVILYLRRNRRWIPLYEAFQTGWDHGFLPKLKGEIKDG